MSSRGNETAPPGERELIDLIRRRIPPAPPSLVIGVGDDAAVYVPERGALQVITTDALVEGIHFERRFSSWSDVGHKALAVNLSDLAAMGATPHLALLSLVLPGETTLADVDALLDGFLGLAGSVGVALAGGNIARSPGPLVVDVTAVGHVRPRRVLTRGGGQPGDALYVTGSIGAAVAGLEWLQRDTDHHSQPESEMLGCIQRHRRPEPRMRIGSLLGRNRAASACVDLSDGLADAVRQVAAASGTGARIDVTSLPIDPAVSQWFSGRGQDPVASAIRGGDDFELLFAVPRRRPGRLRHVRQGARGVEITRIGELTADLGVVLDRAGHLEPMPEGYQHLFGRERDRQA